MIRLHIAPGAHLAIPAGLLVLLFCFSGEAAAGALQGVVCCAEQLIPSLLPFMIVCEWLMRDPDAHRIGVLFSPLSRLMGCRAPAGGTVLLLSWLGGFAASARCISIAFRSGQLTRREAEGLLPGCISPSPSFILVTVGTMMLREQRLGIALLIAIMGANLVCGALIGRFWNRRSSPAEPHTAPHHSESHNDGFAAAVQSATQSMLTICTLVIFFSSAGALCTRFLPEKAGHILAAFLEMTNGCRLFSVLGAGHAALCCATLSWMGVSALVQVRALLPLEISLIPLIAARLLHLPCALLLLRLALCILPGETPAFSSLPAQVFPLSHTAPDAAFVLFLLCCLTLYRLEQVH